MRPFLFFSLLLVSSMFVACKSSDENTATNGSARPAVGSLFFYTQAILDSNGQVDSTAYRTDSVWRVLANDTTISGFAHVVQFASGDSINASYHPRRLNMRYLDNGDIAVSEESNEGFDPWVTLPMGSRKTIFSNIDSTIDTHDGIFHMTGSMKSEFIGTAVVSLTPKPLDAVVGFTTLTGIMARSGDTGRFIVKRTWTYVPTIGFFTFIKEDQTGNDVDGHPENHGSRMDLYRYELK